MKRFNKLYKNILETTTTAVFGGVIGGYAPGDNRPIEPSSIVLGNKKKNNKKPRLQKRPRIETVILRSK